jgi:RNA polymerase sigma factor (sigma-70 family)
MNQEQVVENVRRAAEGDQEAWNALVKQYSGLLWSVVRGFRLGEQQSADVVQTTWLRLVEHISRIRDPQRVAAWLVMTARNGCIDAIRQARRQRPLDDEYELPSPDESPEGVVLRYERVTLVREAMTLLSERDRELLTLLSVSPPLPYGEISARLSMPVGSIGPTRMRALGRLRTELERSGLVDAVAR